MTGLVPSELAKFHPFLHRYLPPLVPAWEHALASVDVTATHNAPPWPFWVPEARLVVCSDTPARQRRFILNWLRVRTAWYYLLERRNGDDTVVVPLKAPQWREYLNTSERLAEEIASTNKSRHAEMKREVASIFQQVFGGDIMACEVPDEWFGRAVNALDDGQWSRLSREVAWELSDVGFRVELCELDQVLAPAVAGDDFEAEKRYDRVKRVFPYDGGLTLKALPQKPLGLASELIRERAPHLEALRSLICRWPSAPSAVVSCPPFTVMSSRPLFLEREHLLLSFYCQTFYSIAGRAPILPRRFPVDEVVRAHVL